MGGRVVEKVLGDVFNAVLGIKDTLDLSIGEIKNFVSEGQDAHRNEIEFLMFAARRAPLSNAGRLQDLWVLFEHGEKRDGNFVEFGATDGVTGRSTLLLEHIYGWRGAIAEPARSWNQTLRARKSCYMTDRFIYKDDGLKILYRDVNGSEESPAPASAGGTAPAVARRSGRRYEVETLSLRSFLRAAEAPKAIDYMKINVEDDAIDVLKHFDFSEYGIRLLSVAGGDQARRDEVREILLARGYATTFKTFSVSEDWYVEGGGAAPHSARA